MQTLRARRIELDGREMNGRGAPGGGGSPAAHERGCSLLLTDAERAYLEGRLGDLTRREREVIFALCSGGTNEGMAERLCIALPTLRTHLMRLNQKLGTSSKGDVIRLVAAHLLGAYRSRRIEPGGGTSGARAPEAGLRA